MLRKKKKKKMEEEEEDEEDQWEVVTFKRERKISALLLNVNDMNLKRKRLCLRKN